MLTNLLIGGLLIALTVIIHASALDMILRSIAKFERFMLHHARPLWQAVVISYVVLAVFIAHVIEMWIWALYYLKAGALTTVESALYFSVASFTTAGYGDVVLDEGHRIMSAIEAANGFLLFGWSTAFIFGITQRLYKRQNERIKSG